MENLLREGIDRGKIYVTGNTGIDTLAYVVEKGPMHIESIPEVGEVGSNRLLLVTAHRRESFGLPLEGICRAIQRLVRIYPDLHVVFPVHPNPKVYHTVSEILGSESSISLIKPLVYPDFVHIMLKADLIMTDSGGIQEEACYLGKRVVLMRDFTERPEAVEEGFVTMAGRDEEGLFNTASELLSNSMSPLNGKRTVFGTGDAGRRIMEHILESSEELKLRDSSAFSESQKKLCIFSP
jgi:UDP-N-acetylglucosamine 2-epimerase (non-hydrolysing)